MQLVTIICCLVLFALVVLLTPVAGGSALSQRSRTTTLPPKKERLPFTPVKNSTWKERQPYTPPKTTTPRPYLRLRTTTTRRVPFPSRTTVKPSSCNCQCDLTAEALICAGSGAELETFVNQCQLDCFNCTFNKRYRVIKPGKC